MPSSAPTVGGFVEILAYRRALKNNVDRAQEIQAISDQLNDLYNRGAATNLHILCPFSPPRASNKGVLPTFYFAPARYRKIVADVVTVPLAEPAMAVFVSGAAIINQWTSGIHCSPDKATRAEILWPLNL